MNGSASAFWAVTGKATLPVVLTLLPVLVLASSPPDIRSVDADLVVPGVSPGPPSPGKRVFQTDVESGVDSVVYLPADWQPGGSFPVIIELPGNGGYRNRFGDECSGLPEGCKLGYGITEGQGAIWISVPFLDASGTNAAITWWGSPPGYDPATTVALLKRTIRWACQLQWGGDPDRVFLAGFSRGAIACNVIGLHDDAIARMWRGMICYSHYEGVRTQWPFAGSDRASALARLERLADTPQFICHETRELSPTPLELTRRYLDGALPSGQFTFQKTGFRNHNDAWVLRPSAARTALRQWYRRLSHVHRGGP